MENILNGPKIGLVLLSPDLRVIALNYFARKVFGSEPGELVKNLFQYHPLKSRERLRGIIPIRNDIRRRLTQTPPWAVRKH